MRRLLTRLALLALTAASLPACAHDFDNNGYDRHGNNHSPVASVQLGPRPFFLVNEMADGPLKQRLQHCAATRESYRPTLFSIGHRGAPLQFPEHTKESYEAAARMGAGIVECDLTFTKDKELGPVRTATRGREGQSQGANQGASCRPHSCAGQRCNAEWPLATGLPKGL